jgi:hypothetical protein
VPYEIKLVTIRRRDGSGALDPAHPDPGGVRCNEKWPENTETAAFALFAANAVVCNPNIRTTRSENFASWLLDDG